MMTQNVKTQAMNLFGKTESSKSAPKTSNKAKTSFGQVMQKNVEETKPTETKAQGKLDKKDAVSDKKDAAKESTTEAKDDATQTKPPIITSDEKGADKAAEDSAAMDNVELFEEEVPLEVLSNVMSQLQLLIFNTVKDTLNLSEEALNNAMQELNLSPADLMEPANMAKLVLQVNNCEDPMNLLTNEAMSKQLTMLTKAMEELQLPEEFGITKEQIMELLKKESQVMEDGSNKEILTEEKGSQELQRMSSKDKSLETDTEEKEISIHVEKQGVQNSTVQNEMKDGSLTQNQQNAPKDSKQEEGHSAKAPVDTFVENLAVKGQTQDVSVESVKSRVEVMRNIVEQVVEQIKVIIKPEATSMELQLNPENLGKVNLVVASKDGHLTAILTAQNDIAKEALESQIQVLRENLNNQGLKVEAVEVNVSNFGLDARQNNNQTSKEQGKSKNSNRRKIDLESFDENMSGVTEEEILAAKVLEQNGGSIDYTA